MADRYNDRSTKPCICKATCYKEYKKKHQTLEHTLHPLVQNMSLSLTFIYASSNRFVASSFRVSRNNIEEKNKFTLRPREHIAAVLQSGFTRAQSQR